jgi:RNA polymerase sigma factor (sigma-70 family)
VEGRPLAEVELVRRAKRADVTAYSELVRRYQTVAFRTAYLVTGSAEDAEESAQDGFVKAFSALDRFDESRPFRPWLLEIVANDARNRVRSRVRREARQLRSLDGFGGEAAPSPPDPFRLAEARSDALRLVARLRPEEQRVVLAKFAVGLTDEEIGRALGLPVGTVKSRLSRALAHLRAELEAVE